MVDRQNSSDEFQDCHEQDNQIRTNGAAANGDADVIQISSNDIEEVKVYDAESARQFSIQGCQCGPNSFSDPRVPVEGDCPAPKYLSNEVILAPLATHKNDYLQGLQLNNEGCLVCTDQEALDKQKGVLTNVAKQLAINLMKGLSISHISLPIKIFEGRSSIQRVVDLWSSAPQYLKAAAEATDPIQRFKYVIAFGLTSIVLCAGQNKPFNPLLGETNQGGFADGSRYYCEHTSHHPPITHYLLEGPNESYRLHGYYEFIGKMGKNSLTSGLRGPSTVEFPNGTKIRFNAPDFKLGGTIVGERTIECTGSILFEDLTNQLRAVVVMGTFKSSGFFSKTQSGSRSDFTGQIYQTKPGVRATLFGKDQKLPEDLKKLADVKKVVCEIQGNWLQELSIGQQQFWHVDTHQVTRQIPQTELDGRGLLAASDWRFREDLIWLKYGFQAIAASWKLRLEVQQRKDRKNRQDREKARANRR